MKIETQALPDFRSNRNIIEPPPQDVQQTDEDVTLEWPLPCQMQEPILWPRVFPGL
jgi:hypothetical protein